MFWEQEHTGARTLYLFCCFSVFSVKRNRNDHSPDFFVIHQNIHLAPLIVFDINSPTYWLFKSLYVSEKDFPVLNISAVMRYFLNIL